MALTPIFSGRSWDTNQYLYWYMLNAEYCLRFDPITGDSVYNASGVITDYELEGYLSKWRVYYPDDDSIQYIKASRYDEETFEELFESISEVACSEILRLLHLKCGFVTYWLCRIDTMDAWHRYCQRTACICNNFLGPLEEFITAREILGVQLQDASDVFDVEGYFENTMCVLFQETGLNGIPEYFYEIMIFDYLIGNIDRHLGNVGFIRDENLNYRFAPIFDNGCALLGCFSEEVLKLSPEEISDIIESGTFSSSFDEQLDLIPLTFLTEYREPIFRYARCIRSVAEHFRSYWGDFRTDRVIAFLEDRCGLFLSYLEEREESDVGSCKLENSRALYV